MTRQLQETGGGERGREGRRGRGERGEEGKEGERDGGKINRTGSFIHLPCQVQPQDTRLTNLFSK